MSEKLTDTELSEIRARAEAATPGPWAFDNYPLGEGLSILGSGGHIVIDDGSAGGEYGSSTTIENMRFIRDARKDIPALLAHIDEQRAEIEHLKRALEYACKFGEKFCYRFGVVNGCFDCPAMIGRNRISPSPFCKGWLSAALDATKETSSE